MPFGDKLNPTELHLVLLDALGGCVTSHSDVTEKPLIFTLRETGGIKFETYLYNITNPPGARQAGECKSQLIFPGQKRGAHWHFAPKEDTLIILAGFAQMLGDVESGAFVFWELEKHRDPAYSANIQVSLETLLKTTSQSVFRKKKRGNGEWEVVCRREYAYQGLMLRMSTDREIMLGEEVGSGTYRLQF